jgi:hypothetical protein
MRNPRFEHDFATAYAQKGEALPAQVFWPSLWRLYSHLRHGEEIKYLDPAGCEAIALADPSNRTAQELIEGLLCSGLGYKEVAQCSGQSLEVIELYACWFFDFVARQEDATFVGRVLNPSDELSLVRSDSAPDSLVLARRVGHEQGPEALIRMLWLKRTKGAKASPGENIRQVLLARGEMKARLGLLNTDDPEFAAFKMHSTVQANQPQGNLGTRGFDWISSDKASQEVIKQTLDRSARQQIKAVQEYDAQQAAEALKKAMDKNPV